MGVTSIPYRDFGHSESKRFTFLSPVWGVESRSPVVPYSEPLYRRPPGLGPHLLCPVPLSGYGRGGSRDWSRPDRRKYGLFGDRGTGDVPTLLSLPGG